MSVIRLELETPDAQGNIGAWTYTLHYLEEEHTNYLHLLDYIGLQITGAHHDLYPLHSIVHVKTPQMRIYHKGVLVTWAGSGQANEQIISCVLSFHLSIGRHARKFLVSQQSREARWRRASHDDAYQQQ